MMQSVALACHSAAVLATEDTGKIKRRTLRFRILLFIGLAYHLMSALSNLVLVDVYSGVLQVSLGAFSFFLGYAGLLMQWPALLFSYVIWMLLFTAVTALGGVLVFCGAVASRFGLEVEFSSPLHAMMTVAGLTLVVFYSLFCLKDGYFVARCYQKMFSESRAGQKTELPIVHQPPFNFGKIEV